MSVILYLTSLVSSIKVILISKLQLFSDNSTATVGSPTYGEQSFRYNKKGLYNCHKDEYCIKLFLPNIVLHGMSGLSANKMELALP